MHTVQGGDELAEPEVVLLPILWLFSRIGQGHVKLHVLDLAITQAAGEVVYLSTSDLPVSGEDTPQCWVVNESASSAGPPLSGSLRTSHHIPHTPPRFPAW